jgi:hypothetical protein
MVIESTALTHLFSKGYVLQFEKFLRNNDKIKVREEG